MKNNLTFQEPHKLPKISISAMQSFLACRRMWKYSYREYLESKETAVQLQDGIGIHNALAEYYRTGVKPVIVFKKWARAEEKKLFDKGRFTEEMTEFDDRVQLVKGILRNYYKYVRNHGDFQVFNINKKPAVEMGLEIPIYSPTTKGKVIGIFALVLDLLVVGTSDEILVVDHKSMTNKQDEAEKQQRNQLVGYAYAVTQKFDIRVEGGIINGLRKKLPVKPELLKSGRLSSRLNIDTTFDAYMKALEEYELDPDDYADVLNALKDAPNTFFPRIFTPITKKEIRSFAEHLPFIFLDMSNPTLPLYPNFSYNCRFCRFKDLCDCEEKGEDTAYFKEQFYQKRAYPTK